MIKSSKKAFLCVTKRFVSSKGKLIAIKILLPKYFYRKTVRLAFLKEASNHSSINFNLFPVLRNLKVLFTPPGGIECQDKPCEKYSHEKSPQKDIMLFSCVSVNIQKSAICTIRWCRMWKQTISKFSLSLGLALP